MRYVLAVVLVAIVQSFGASQDKIDRSVLKFQVGSNVKDGSLSGDVYALSYLDNRILFVGTALGWNAIDLDRAQWRLLKPVGGPAFSVARDRQRILVGSRLKVHLIEPVESASMEPANSIESASESVAALAVERLRLVFADGEKKLAILDLGNGKVSGHVDLISSPVAATMTANGRIVAAATQDGAIRVFSVSSAGKAEPLFVRRVARSSRIACAFSPDGRLLAVSSAGRIVLLESVAGRPVQSLDRRFGEGDIRTLAFSADSRLIACGTNGPEPIVRIWDIETGKDVATFVGHQGDMNSITFSLDSKHLASGGTDRTVRIWRVPALPPAADSMIVSDVWDRLDSLDGALAHRAMGGLLANPPLAGALIQKGIASFTGEQKKAIRRIAELDHDDFRVREKAQAAVLSSGIRVTPLLVDPTRKRMGAEGEQRITRILEIFENQGFHVPDSGFFGDDLRAVRGIRMLEMIGGPQARLTLEEIAKGPEASRAVREAKAALLWLP